MALPEMCITVPLRELKSVKYGQVICYPRYESEEAEKRISDMEKLGVKSFCFTGGKTVANLPVLGKGCTSIVVLVILKDDSEAALKISRVDSEMGRIHHEARMLHIANSVGVGPKILGYTDRLLLMEYIDGKPILEWIKDLDRGKESSRRFKNILRDVLEQCWRLDSAGLDHGELSRADKHIIVDRRDKAHIVDFETASDRRRPSNVTSVSQYLFIRSPVAKIFNERIRPINMEALIQSLRRYKEKRSRENFEAILSVLNLVGA
ncbi:MAG: serine/threonine protein kinase [Candidatus Bathyarchaeota archaeon]|nr:serine/threonine protein kinase [Candidatus Bathyarchaeota archaeon]